MLELRWIAAAHTLDIAIMALHQEFTLVCDYCSTLSGSRKLSEKKALD